MEAICIIIRSDSGFDLWRIVGLGHDGNDVRRFKTKKKKTKDDEGDAHHLPKVFTLEDFSDLRTHSGQLGVGSDDLIDDGGIGHDAGELLKGFR
jgi:hypothetical protein